MDKINMENEKVSKGADRKRNIGLIVIGVGLFACGILVGTLSGPSCHRSTVHYVTHKRSEFRSEIIHVREVEKSMSPVTDTEISNSNHQKQNQTTASEPISSIWTATRLKTEVTVTTPKPTTSTTPDHWEETDAIYDYYSPEEEEPVVKRLENQSPRRYYVSPPNDKLNWFGALQSCAGMNMELLSIENEAENRLVDLLIKRIIQDDYENYYSPDPSDDFWSAGTNLWTSETSKFYWATTGEKINSTGFANWHAGNPNLPELQHCVEITKNLDSPTSGSYKWNDYGCHIKARYICEGPQLLV